MRQRFKSLAVLTLSGAMLVACGPPKPTMTLEEAKAACQERVANPVSTKVGVGIRGGSGGKVSTGVGLSVGVDLSAATDPQGTYEKCVKRNSGHDVTQPLEQ